VRISPQNAATLYALVEEKGIKNTQVVLTGTTPGGESKVASQPAHPRYWDTAPWFAYYKQLVPNFEALLPTSNCPSCVPTTVPPDSALDGLAMANIVERLGGAIVSPHSQSGIHILHMIRILKERGELNLVKGIIIPESAIGLPNLMNAGITPKDFDSIPLLIMNGDYRTAAARNLNREMIAAINASTTRSVGPATYVDLDDPSFGGKFLGQTHMNMLGTTNIALFDYFQAWADKNIPNPIVATSCPSGNGQGNNGL
jgi:hypothetical protein